MNRLLLFTFCVMFSLGVKAQPKGYQPIKNVAEFQQKLSTATASLKSLQSDFVQTKHLALLADKIVSKGLFSYQKDDKVRIEYKTPFQYLMVMNGGTILVRDEQKSTRINTRNSKMMQSVNRIMVDCMSGRVFSNPDFKVSAYSSSSRDLLLLRPVSADLQRIYSSIEVYLNKSDMDVVMLVLKEPNGDYTEMVYSGTRHNLALNESLFKTR